MDPLADFAMPSPKRMRFDSSRPGASDMLPKPVDETKDIPGSLSHENDVDEKPHGDALPAKGVPSPAFLGFQLPGLPPIGETQTESSEPMDHNPSSVGPDLFGLMSPQRDEMISVEKLGNEQKSSEKDILMEMLEKPESALSTVTPLVAGTEEDGRPLQAFEDPAATVEKSSGEAGDDSFDAKDNQQLDQKSQGAVTSVYLGENLTEAEVTHDAIGKPAAEDTGINLGKEKPDETLSDQKPIQNGTNGGISMELDTKMDMGLPETSGLTTTTFEQAAEANKSNPEAEFEMDSSPFESSSSDTSTDTSSSDDSDAEDYEMLSPEEEARRLMAEDGAGEGKTVSDVPHTLNEKPEEVVPKPQVTITADMQIETLGSVQTLVENLALIKANISGEYQVLESGSVLCLEDRSVIGVISETLGRVHQPFYSIRFTNANAMTEAGVLQGTKIFYVVQYSTTVFTQPLRSYKGSDASNLHDEEVGDDELEFSDDEAEAEHKRQVKMQRRAKFDAKHSQEDRFSRGAQRNPRDSFKQVEKTLNSLPEHPPDPSEPSLNYDDAKDDSDDLYTPLARPSNLHEMMTSKNGSIHAPAIRGDHNPRGGRGRGRGDRGANRRGRQHGNDRGRSDGRQQHNPRGNGQFHAHPGANSHSPSGRPNNNGFPTPNNPLPPRPTQQSSGFQSHPQPQDHSIQTPSYSQPSVSQPHSHSHYPSQYPSSYGQFYPQNYQQPQYQQDPYLQGISRQGYLPQQDFSPGLQYSAQQMPLTPSTPAAIPPGAHINPNFFRQQGQNSPQNWHQQQSQFSSPPQHYQHYQRLPPASNNAGPQMQLSPEAARKLQENLNRITGTNAGSDPQTG